jgi:phasin family protein
MFPTQDQYSTAAKNNFAAGIALYTTLTSKTLESVEKLITLNLTAAKASMEESTAATRQLLAAKDPQEFLSLVNAQAKPNFEKAIAYSTHLANIASSAQADFKEATEAQIAEMTRKVSELNEEAGKNAPAGSENLTNMIKTMFGNAANGYEQFNKTARQAVDAMGANLNTAASLVTPVVATPKTTVEG